MDDIFGEVFRSVFGLPRRNVPRDYSNPDNEPQQRPDDFYGGGAFFMRPFPFFGGIFSHMDPHDDFIRREDQPGHGANRQDPFGMFHMFEHMRSLFEGFGLNDFPDPNRALMPPSSDSKTPRDDMLKEPESKPPASPFFDWSSQLPDIYGDSSLPKKQDSDLDREVEQGNLDVILGDGLGKSDGRFQPSPNVRRSQSFRSVTVHTYRNINGEIEEQRTVRDGQGNEETIITRQVGDKRHVVKKQKDPSGVERITETYDNIDDNEIQDFDSKWNTRRLPPDGSTSHPPSDGYQLDPDTRSIFRKLFGQNFPMFPRSES